MLKYAPFDNGHYFQTLRWIFLIDKISTKFGWAQSRWYSKTLLIIRIILYISLVLYPLFCFFMIEYMNFDGGLTRLLSWLNYFPLSAAFGALLVSLIFGLLFIAVGKAAIAAGILGLASLGFGFTNYMKVATNGDNLFPQDFAMIGNLGELTAFASGIHVPWFFWAGAIVIILWVAVFAFFNIEMPINWKIRIPSVAVIVLALILAFSPQERTGALLYRFNMNLMDAALQSSNYTANGLVGAFMVNIFSMHVERPADYSRETIGALLDGFEYTAATREYFDVIVVLSESFFDVRTLPGLEFSENPLPHFDDIIARPNAYSGRVYTTARTGGTVRPEFDILTGLTTDFLPSGSNPYGLISRPLSSHVSQYREAGYHTIALHPFDKRFYMRHLAYPLLGFDLFFDEAQITEKFEVEYNQIGLVTDLSLFPAIEYYFRQAEIDDVPMFMKVITMQNHQPFLPMPEDEIRVRVVSDDLDYNVLSAVTTYTQGLSDADKMLGLLADFIDTRDRPTIMLFYGDHLPNLGGNLAAFTQTGLIDPARMYAPEARALMYSTPFIIYANRTLNPILPNRDNHISTYYLLSIIAYQTGFHRTPYMNLLLDYFSRVPFHNMRLYLPVTDEIISLDRVKQLITYDRLMGNNYSD